MSAGCRLEPVVTLACTTCQLTWAPDLAAFDTGNTSCPWCGGWTWIAQLIPAPRDGWWSVMTAATELTPPPASTARPACWGVDPELFYGPADSPERGPVLAWERRALRVCADCPVQAACLSSALEFPADEQHGVIGGMTAGQRRVLLRTTRQRPARSSMTETPRSQRQLVAAAIRLHQAGHSGRQIAARLKVGERRVQRWLAVHRTGLATNPEHSGVAS
jgi:hypothetical protein